MRLAIVGAASSHVDQVLRLVRAGSLGPEVDVVVVAAPDAEPVPDERLAAFGARGVPAVRTGDPAAAARAVLRHGADAVLVATRDATGHRALTAPLLRADLPVLVDKPFTADPDDAAALVALAAARGVGLTSASALRFHAGATALAARWRAAPGGLAVHATGPADQASPHGGLAFAAVHVVELALAALRDRPAGPVPVAAAAGVRTAVVPAGRDVATITVTTPLDGAGTPYHLAVTGPAGREDLRVDLADDYLRPVLARFVTGVRTGVVAPSGAALVDSVRVLAALCA